MPRTRIRSDQEQDISFVSEKELNQFFDSVVITGTVDDTNVIQSFNDYFPGRNLVVAGPGIVVATGTGFVQLSTTGSGVVAGVDQITASGTTLSGSIILEGIGSVSLHPSGQTITISGSSVGTAGDFITETDHEVIDSLVHNLAETAITEITRNVQNQVTDVDVRTLPVTGTLIRSTSITRNQAGQVTDVADNQHDAAGTIIQTITTTINRSQGQVVSVDTVET